MQCEWCGREAVYYAEYKSVREPLCEVCWEWVKLYYEEEELKKRFK